jgi:nitrous oxide reductase accessory protein NosL
MFYLITLCLVAVSFAAGPADVAPSKDYRCPVCGMFVSMFADWNATIVFKDSAFAIFDGSKDMFKYYLDIKKYNPLKSKDEVSAILVKDYYSTADIDAWQAFFVIWSDVYGPMGHEPIPFEKEADAKEFLREHKGTKILRFKDVTPEIILSLDNP